MDLDIVWLRKLFERATFGFYKAVLGSEDWSVQLGKKLAWQITDKTPGIDEILPQMTTDIILDVPGRSHRIVIDTKFNSVLTKGYYRDQTLRSGYLYQIYAYLQSQVGTSAIANRASGILLHPSVGTEVDETVVIQEHRIRFPTVDLVANSKEIRDRFVEIAKTWSIQISNTPDT